MGDYKTADKWVRKGLEMAKKTNDTELQEELQETLDNIQELR
jgi:tetratricopeptide repeat protein